jgi:hypothetical protein
MNQHYLILDYAKMRRNKINFYSQRVYIEYQKFVVPSPHAILNEHLLSNYYIHLKSASMSSL